MKTIKIRHNVFETNSSSTHSICIAKDATLTIKTALHFTSGEFGWEHDTLKSVHEKASYLFTGFYANGREDDFKKLIELLISKGIDATYDDECDGYIDHSNELHIFLNAICSSEDKLMSYLFSDLSFIITGNDNSDTDVSINVFYPHYNYYKGN